MRTTIALVRALLLPLLAALSLDCAASPFLVRLGAERIALDVPPGFADTLDLGSPRLQDLAETLTSASNRILVFAITDGDLRRFQQGDTPEFRRYLLIATPRSLERERVGLAHVHGGQPVDVRLADVEDAVALQRHGVGHGRRAPLE